MISIVKQAVREIEVLPNSIREDLADALARLDAGQVLSMPLSRALPSIGKGVHELRLKDRTGIFRVFYYVRVGNRIFLLHAFKKKSQATPLQVLRLVQKRLREVL